MSGNLHIETSWHGPSTDQSRRRVRHSRWVAFSRAAGNPAVKEIFRRASVSLASFLASETLALREKRYLISTSGGVLLINSRLMANLPWKKVVKHQVTQNQSWKNPCPRKLYQSQSSSLYQLLAWSW